MDNKTENKKEGMSIYTAIVMVVAILLVVAYMMFFKGKGGTSEATGNGCGINAHSAWGQTPATVWVELGSYLEAKAVTEFDFETPENPLDEYPEIHYRAYTKEVFEVYYTDAAGKEGIRFSKAHECDGKEVYEPKDGVYRSLLIEDVNGTDVKEYGDGEKVSILFWTDGEFSYTILAEDNPLDKEFAESLISGIK